MPLFWNGHEDAAASVLKRGSYEPEIVGSNPIGNRLFFWILIKHNLKLFVYIYIIHLEFLNHNSWTYQELPTYTIIMRICIH